MLWWNYNENCFFFIVKYWIKKMMSAYLKSQIGEICVNQPEEQHKGEIDEKEKPFGVFCILHVAC